MKFLILVMFSLMFFSCAKEVSKSGSNNLTPSNPATVPNSSKEDVKFANHTTVVGETEISKIRVKDNLYIVVPTTVKNTSYNSSTTHPSLALYVNDNLQCVYLWRGSRYETDSFNCYRDVSVNVGDLIVLEGIPNGHTVTLEFNYSKR